MLKKMGGVGRSLPLRALSAALSKLLKKKRTTRRSKMRNTIGEPLWGFCIYLLNFNIYSYWLMWRNTSNLTTSLNNRESITEVTRMSGRKKKSDKRQEKRKRWYDLYDQQWEVVQCCQDVPMVNHVLSLGAGWRCDNMLSQGDKQPKTTHGTAYPSFTRSDRTGGSFVIKVVGNECEELSGDRSNDRSMAWC